MSSALVTDGETHCGRVTARREAGKLVVGENELLVEAGIGSLERKYRGAAGTMTIGGVDHERGRGMALASVHFLVLRVGSDDEEILSGLSAQELRFVQTRLKEWKASQAAP